MKKLVLATALAALATTVSAQNVQIYGIIDAGFQNHDNGTDSYTRGSDNALATSRLGFRGSEDLGNGIKANFQLEAQLNPSSGSMGSTTVATNETFNREAWVGISSTSLGELRIGRQDVTYAQDIDTGTSQFNNFGNRAINGTSIELGSDVKNTVKYITPKIGGFYAQAGWASANNVGSTTDTSGDHKGALVGYDDGRLKLFAGFHKVDATAAAGDRDFRAFGAAYDLGYAQVGVTYAEGDVNNANGADNKSTQGSVRVPLGNGFAAHAVYAVAKDGAQSTDGEGKGYTVGVTKALSKRTTLYAAYTAVDNEANAKMYMAGQGAAPATAGLDTKTMYVGLAHSF
jgi:general bacterial porin, GBP family